VLFPVFSLDIWQPLIIETVKRNKNYKLSPAHQRVDFKTQTFHHYHRAGYPYHRNNIEKPAWGPSVSWFFVCFPVLRQPPMVQFGLHNRWLEWNSAVSRSKLSVCGQTVPFRCGSILTPAELWDNLVRNVKSISCPLNACQSRNAIDIMYIWLHIVSLPEQSNVSLPDLINQSPFL